MENQALFNHFLKLVSELEDRIAGKVVSQLLEHSSAFAETSAKHERLLKPSELCDALQISLSQFYKMKKAHKKDFPYYDVAGAARYKRTEVEQFIKNLKTIQDGKLKQ